MALTVALIFVLFVVASGVLVRARWRRTMAEEHSISPRALHQLMQSSSELLLFDVRLPLDLLAHSEIIPGAIRLPPKEVTVRAESISKEKDIVIYGTCLDDKTLRLVIKITERLRFCRVKMLLGGFEAWKAEGLPIEPYTTAFHLDTQTS